MSQRAIGISEIDELKETVQLLASLWEAAQRLPEGSDRQEALKQIGGFQRRLEALVRLSAHETREVHPAKWQPERLTNERVG